MDEQGLVFGLEMKEKSKIGIGFFPLRSVFWISLVLMYQEGSGETAAAMEIREVYCTSERFVARCSGSDVILVRSALYGRPHPSRCITSEYSHAMGCYSDVTSYMDDLCSGRQNCSMLVAVVDSIAQPCAKDFKSYLEVAYECIRVSFVDDCQLGNLTLLTGNRGYMAISPKPKHRTPEERVSFCAWVISVDAGQRVNITWHHITSGSVSLGESTAGVAEETGSFGGAKGSNVFMWPHRCLFSLRFVESGGEEYVHKRCRPHPGEGAIYLSKTNQVQVQVRMNPKELKGATDNDPIVSWRPYVLFYQAYGCPDLLLPDSATITRRGDDIAIICNNSMEIFYITCQYNRWIGDIGNCSRSGQKERATSGIGLPQFNADFLSDVAFAVVIGILLGICSGAVVILLTSQLRRGRRKYHGGRDGGFREPYTIDAKADDFDVIVESTEDATEDTSSKLHPMNCLSGRGQRRTPFMVSCNSTEEVYTVDGSIHGRYINALPVHCHGELTGQRGLVKPPTFQTIFEMESFHAKTPLHVTYFEEEDEEDDEESIQTAVNSTAEGVRISRT